jgi:hypothetical protein
MYSSQMLEMLSQSIHAERLASAERQRLALVPESRSATPWTSFADNFQGRLVRALKTIAVRTGRQPGAEPNRLLAHGE